MRPFLGAQGLSYLDHATWYEEQGRVDWFFEIGVFPDAVDCRGSNTFLPGAAAGSTEVTLTGALTVDLARVRGVPRVLRGMAPAVERFVLDRVRPNLSGVTAAVARYLDEQR